MRVRVKERERKVECVSQSDKIIIFKKSIFEKSKIEKSKNRKSKNRKSTYRKYESESESERERGRWSVYPSQRK